MTSNNNQTINFKRNQQFDMESDANPHYKSFQ